MAKSRERERGLGGVLENVTVHDVSQLTVHKIVPKEFFEEPPQESIFAELDALIKQATPPQFLDMPINLSAVNNNILYEIYRQLVAVRLGALSIHINDKIKELEATDDPAKASILFRKTRDLIRYGAEYVIMRSLFDVQALFTHASTFPMNALTWAMKYGKLPITGRRPELQQRQAGEEATTTAVGGGR
jgi:hypothetical protein